VDAIICDPPYPEISRPYGRLTEAEWWSLMMDVCREVRRVLKPAGSAVFVLQPNSRKVGSMRPWLFEFQAWACREWNMVQDAYWWNITAMPEAHAIQGGLMRPSVKACVWLGPPDCYRNQAAVLWEESARNAHLRLSERFENRHTYPGGHGKDSGIYQVSAERGGVTPFNVIPAGSGRMAGMAGHPAGTPINVADWLVRFISPPNGLVCDPFMGSGTVGLAALKRGRSFIGFEQMHEYFAIAESRINAEINKHPLLATLRTPNA
jgi:hypothetical protein